MSYFFSPADVDVENPPPGTPSVSLNIHQMRTVREVLRELGVARDNLPQALEAKGFAHTERSLDMKKLRSNDGWHITADECTFLAERVDAGIAQGLHALYASFNDEPTAEELAAWLSELAAFARGAAPRGGMRVYGGGAGAIC